MSTQPQVTWEGLRYAVDKICEERGWIYGCPIPSLGAQHRRPLTIARGVPGREHFLEMQKEYSKDDPEFAHTCTHDNVDEQTYVSHHWSRPGRTYWFGFDSKGRFGIPVSHHSTERLRFLLNTISTRVGAVNFETELTAWHKLSEHLNQTQNDAYIVSGAFAETSKRSHITYILRKGLPTIALTPRKVEGSMEFLAALCLHPLAYYDGTWCGSMAPSDEVLAHLLYIRCDEYNFWKRAGQHSIDDPASGI